uniref:Calponin-homology (CH) domain-containing protein n=1 Tax=Schistocephalus solidus TaxID=70667 RepID=A0A0V0J843_SCHSO
MDSIIGEISKRPKLYEEGYVDSEDEEEMSQKERDLAEDAEWKIFQKNTFTRWANEHLKQAKTSVNDIQTDFSDGLRLISLVEVLSGQKFARVNKRPNFRTQKLENVTMVLKFLEEHEGLKLVNIDSTDIVDSRLKLILGLIWTLILHYSISLPMWEGEEELPQDDRGKGPTAKQRIVSWVNSKMPDLPVKNLTTDWNSGVAIGALVDACAPGLCPDWDSWGNRKPIENATEAMTAAEQWLDVPQLIRPEEMIDPKVDEKAMMTYLSQFPNAKLKEGAPLRPKINPARVRAYGPGLEPTGNTIGTPARFTVETFSAGRAALEVIVLSPSGESVPCEVIKNEDRNLTYSCSYVPKKEGQYRVIIKYSSKEIPNSPYMVEVQGAPGDPKKVKLSGPGIQENGANFVGRRTFFNAFTTEAGAGTLAVEITDPSGRKDTIKPRITRADEQSPYLIEYTPKIEGLHQVSVYFAGQQVPTTPLPVTVGPRETPKASNPGLAYATGRGVRPRGIRAQDTAVFQVHTEQAGEGNLAVNIKRPDGQPEPVKVTRVSDNLYECTYSPQRPGQYVLDVEYGDGHIRGSPFKVVVGPYVKSAIRAFGPGLHGGVVNRPNVFTVATNGSTGALGFLIEGPSDAKINCEDNGDGSVLVSYTVSQPGEYAVHITTDDEDITDSPFMANISSQIGIDIDKITVSGRGITPKPGNVVKGVPTEFVIDLGQALSQAQAVATQLKTSVQGLLKVECHDSFGEPVPVEIVPTTEGRFTCKYTARKVGVITVNMAIAGVGLRESGTRVPVDSDVALKNVKLFGPGLETAKVNQTTYFTVDLRDTFPTQEARLGAMKDVLVQITGEKGEVITPRLMDNGDGTWRVEYVTPEATSAICVSVLLAGQQVGQSPYCVPVTPGFDTSKITVTGLDSPVQANKPQQFKLITAGSGAPSHPEPDVVVKPVGSATRVPAKVTPIPEGYDVRYTPPSPGQYTVSADLAKYPIAGPYAVEVVPADQPIPSKGTKSAMKFQPKPTPGAPANPLLAAHNATLQKHPTLIKEPAPLYTGQLVPLEITSPQMAAPPKQAAALCPLQAAPLKSFEPAEMARKLAEVQTASPLQQPDGSGQVAAMNPAPIQATQAVSAQAGLPEQQLQQQQQQPQYGQVPVNQPVPAAVPTTQPSTQIPIAQNFQPIQESQKPANFPAAQSWYKPDPLLQGPGKPGIPRPPILPEEKEEAKSKSLWPQPRPDQPAGLVTAYGPGLEKAVATVSAEFTIDSSKTTPGKLGVVIEGPKQPQVDCQDNGDKTCRVTYIAPVPGTYKLNVLYNGEQHIQGSPFLVQVYPVGKMDLNTDKITAYGPGLSPDGVYMNCISKFIVDATEMDKVGSEEVTATLKAPDNRTYTCNVTNRHDGTYLVTYFGKMEGLHKIDVAYGGVPIPSSPFTVNMVPGFDASRVRAFGPGLEPSGPHLMPDVTTSFTVDMSNAGQGGLGLSIEGPADASINCVDNQDGTCTVEYTPKLAGVYDIKLTYNEVEIPSSPFRVRVQGGSDISKVKCYGPGLEPGKVRVACPAAFVVDSRLAGDVPLEATFTPRPGAASMPVSVHPVADQPGVYECSYVPQAEGPCQVAINCDGQPVVGSPFTIPVRPTQEPEKVRVSGAGLKGPVQASLPSTFTVDTREAGSGDLTVDLMDPVGHSLPISVVPITEEELKKASPYNLNDLVASKTPEELAHPPQDSGLVACTYEPFVVGEHKIHVMFAGTEIPESPFVFNSVPVGRADLCKIKDEVKPKVAVGDETGITVDTTNAGIGKLKCRVTQIVNGRATDLPVEMEDNKDGTVTAYYRPTEPATIQTELRFGGQLIPDGQITQKAVHPEEVDTISTPIEPTYQPLDFRLVVAGRQDQKISGFVIRPSGVHDKVDLKDNSDGTVLVNYQPKERGMHELHVNSLSDGPDGASMPLAGSPYKFFVDNLASGNISAYGPGLSHGVTGQPAEFTVAMKDVGAGGLSVAVEGPSKAEITCHDNGDGTCHVTYYPMAPGEYVIDLKFLDKNIPGSPFVAKITGEPKKRTLMNMSTANCVSFDVGIDDISLLTASVVSPSGREEPCALKNLPNNRMGISFTPKEYGEHFVNVFKAGQHIPKSPFRLNVSPEDVGDPSKVKVIWPQNVPIMANQRNEFVVDSKDAGFATLSLSIEGPSKAEIECVDNNDGTCTVAFYPTEPGVYMVNVKYADKHVPNSPFTINVGGDAPERRVQRIVRRREATDASQVGTRCGITMRLPNVDIRRLTTEVVSPSGRVLPCEIVSVNEGQFTIRFVPQEVGVHLVNVLERGVHIPNSPFQFTVGQPADGGASKVRVSGRGLEYGVVEERNEFSIYTREAGAGSLSIAIEGPSKAEIFFEDQRDGSCVVYYRVRKPGEYVCSIKFRDEHIPFSPFNIYVSDPKEAGRVSTYEIPVQYAAPGTVPEKDNVEIGRPVFFTVHCLESKQVLFASVETPSNKQEEATVHRLDGDQYVVRFVPHESGTHLISVFVVPELESHLGINAPSRQEIDGSPFRIVVGGQMADPSSVFAVGEGLSHGTVGNKNKFFVNTANAGSGVLSVLIDGPSKVQVTCEECEDGYEFAYLPTVPGEYKITIKYGGNFDIYGSPFYAKITGAPMGDMPEISSEQTSMTLKTATKTLQSQQYESLGMVYNPIPANVQCTGLGLKYAMVNKDNVFYVNTSEAGNDLLLAGMAGPKYPCDYFEINHIRDDQYKVTYRVKEKGKYLLVVKWGDEHVPGSPFVVEAGPGR